MNTKELNNVSITDVVTETNKQELVIRSNVTGGNSLSLDHLFQYDHVFCSCDREGCDYASQKDVFENIGKPLLDNAFRGYNACLFAYGQTGSGKSYSMMGDNTGEAIDIDNNAGVTPRFCKELFKRIASLDAPNSSASVEVSYFEIYNEKIHDLLSTSATTRREALKVREHPVWGPYIVDLSVHPVASYKELRACLLTGNKNRATAATAMNEKSSRSHSIFTIEVSLAEGGAEGDVCRRSKVSLVDLAGSERLSNGMSNEERMRQGVSINKSLLTLGKVISALAEQRKGSSLFIPYRESVLTWLLKESLGGNSLTSMLATISPASCNIDETLATLRYACQARSIVNRARINENPHDKLIRELRAEVERLRALRQSYEKNSISSTIYINDSTEHEQELDKLRDELKNTEQRLKNAETNWEQRFTATKEAQLRELAEVEKRKEDLESHLRVIQKSDNGVSLSPYKTNFLRDLESMLNCENKENQQTTKKLGKTAIKTSMDEIYNALSVLQPTVNESPDNIKLMFARINKLLQAFETTLISSVTEGSAEKMVTFNV